MTIDWSAPIEAVHEDGRVVGVTRKYGPDPDGDYGVFPSIDGWFWFRGDGSRWKLQDGWRIRNVAKSKPTATVSQRPSDELVGRMVELVRRMAVPGSADPALSGYRSCGDEARAIVAELPAEVDADLVEAVARAIYRSQPDPYGSEEPTDDDWLEQLENAQRVVWRDLAKAALAVIRGRDLEKGVGA